MRVLANVGFVLGLLLSACSFTPGDFAPGDAGPDGPPPITVGFAKTTTLADETSNAVAIRVVLSEPATEAITVTYAITGGTATQTVDYLGSDGSVTFAPGEVEQAITITVGPDGMEEPDETIELELQSVTGGNAVLATSLHTMTIAANVLPRVSFALASSMDSEAMTTKTFDVSLSVASPLQISVEVAVMGGTATAGGVDYTLSTSTVVFAANDTTEQVTLTINNDTTDEDNETATIELDNAVNAIIGATAAHTYTIEDNDAAPTIAFAAATSSVAEDGTGIDVTVQLSAISGKAIEVPFTVANTSTATVTADYAIPTAATLMFAPGTQQRVIRVNMVQDTALESPETVVIDLGTPMNATLGTTVQHTVTITDDDSTCLGTGAYTACFARPNNTVTLSGEIDTDGAGCATPASGWTGQPSSCFIVAGTLNINAATTVIGTRPLVLFARTDLNITGNIDASSRLGGQPGPGAATQTCNAFTRAATNSTSGAGGGAGGTFRTAGGSGGNGNGAQDTGGAPAGAVGAPTTLRAGCRGQDGGRGNSPPNSNAGVGGFGGGAVYLVAGGTITIGSGITINASGAGAVALDTPAGGHFAGGGGGGSGGMIKLFANAFSVSGARLMANGGGGSGGGDDNDPGESGTDPVIASPNNGGTGGTPQNGGGNGGGGFGESTAVGNGSNGGSNNGGGGGGGGGGHIEANLALTGATVSAGN